MKRRALTTLGLGLMAGLLLEGCDSDESPRTCPCELVYTPEEGQAVSSVSAAGDWNGWDPDRTPLELRADGSFSTMLELEPGDYAYRLIVDDQLIFDPAAPLRTFSADGSRESSLLRLRDCYRPSWDVQEVEASLDGGLRVVAKLQPGKSGPPVAPETVAAALGSGDPLKVSVSASSIIEVSANDLARGRHTVRLTASDSSGNSPPELVLPVWIEAEPLELRDGLIYQIVTDRFAPSGEPWDVDLPPEEAALSRHGGDLEGLAEVVRSGYFERLGVTTLWISPLNDNPDEFWPWYMDRESTAYHGYWPISAREVEPLIGGEQALRELVAEAHGRGLRVIADVVPNHVHVEHPYYTENGFDGWFNGNGECVCGSSCSWAEDLDHCWFSEYLADLDWRNPDVATRVVDDTLYWLEEFELDGLRIDAIPMMPLLATRELVWTVGQRLEQGPVDIHLLGETYTGRDDWDTIARGLGPHGLDGQFEFPLLWEIRRVLARGFGTMTSLDEVVRESERIWAGVGGGADGMAVMSPFIGNHDVPRFLSEAEGVDLTDPFGSPPSPPDSDEPYRRLLLAHAFVLTLPGAPVLYYGDEIGMPGANDPDNRRPMRFDDGLSTREAATLEVVARLGRLRSCLPALRRGARQTLLVGDDVYVYLRDAGDGEPAIVVLNRATTDRSLRFDLPSGLPLHGSNRLVNGLEHFEINIEDGAVGPLAVPPLSGMVLLPSSSNCLGS